MTWQLPSFTYTNPKLPDLGLSEKKTTIFLHQIVKIEWNYLDDAALVRLNGDSQAIVVGDENKQRLCEALGWRP